MGRSMDHYSQNVGPRVEESCKLKLQLIEKGKMLPSFTPPKVPEGQQTRAKQTLLP